MFQSQTAVYTASNPERRFNCLCVRSSTLPMSAALTCQLHWPPHNYWMTRRRDSQSMPRKSFPKDYKPKSVSICNKTYPHNYTLMWHLFKQTGYIWIMYFSEIQEHKTMVIHAVQRTLGRTAVVQDCLLTDVFPFSCTSRVPRRTGAAWLSSGLRESFE